MMRKRLVWRFRLLASDVWSDWIVGQRWRMEAAKDQGHIVRVKK
jgi:hypothetical protein